MTKQYLDDFAAGQVYRCNRLRVDKEQILAFAAQFDPQPYHLDEEAARKSVFKKACGKWMAHSRYDHASFGRE